MAKKKPPRSRKPKGPKAKQGDLGEGFGIAPPIPELDSAAENYYDVMMERVKLSKEEDETKTALIELMRTNNLTRYEYDGRIVMLTDKTNVKIKANKKQSGDDSNEFTE